MATPSLQCVRCGSHYPGADYGKACDKCLPAVPASLTLASVDLRKFGSARENFAKNDQSMWKYDRALPVSADCAVTLGEGVTPLVRMDRLGAQLGLSDFRAKCEFVNPTGSFKDRLASAAVSAAKELFGAKVIATSSTGNAGAAAAAYAAKAGLTCVVFTTDTASPPLLSQMLAVGAIVVATPTKPERWVLMKQGIDAFGWFPTSPFSTPPIGSNPFGVEGYKTLAYELAESYGWQGPDWVVLPVCYGDALYGMWKGFKELVGLGWIESVPRFVAAEIYGSLADAYKTDSTTPRAMEQPYQTMATSITSPQGTFQSLTALRSTKGFPVRVSEAELVQSRRDLAIEEGLHVEAAAAATLSATSQLVSKKVISRDDKVVCLLTAGGLKEEAPKNAVESIIKVPAKLDEMVSIVRDRRGIALEA